MWVCASNLFKANISTSDLPLVLVLLRSWEPKLPLQHNPKLVVCQRNKPINYGNPYNLPLWLFRDKTTTHIDPHKNKRSNGIFYNTKRYKRVNLYVFKSSISCRTINPSTKNKLHFQSKCMWVDQVKNKKQAFAYKILSLTSCNDCECNPPPQRVTPPQCVISPMCTIATTICNSPYHILLPLFVMI